MSDVTVADAIEAPVQQMQERREWARRTLARHRIVAATGYALIAVAVVAVIMGA